MAFNVGIKAIRKSIKRKAKFDIEELTPINYVELCFAPALFVHGAEDTFITPQHSHDLHEKYAGDKNIIVVEGNHNTRRPTFCNDSISIFFQNTLLTDDERMASPEESMSQAFPSIEDLGLYQDNISMSPLREAENAGILSFSEEDDELSEDSRLLQEAMLRSLSDSLDDLHSPPHGERKNETLDEDYDEEEEEYTPDHDREGSVCSPGRKEKKRWYLPLRKMRSKSRDEIVNPPPDIFSPTRRETASSPPPEITYPHTHKRRKKIRHQLLKNIAPTDSPSTSETCSLSEPSSPEKKKRKKKRRPLSRSKKSDKGPPLPEEDTLDDNA